jgi:hypothetical protein
MEIRYQCDEQDYLEAQRAHVRKNLYLSMGLGVLCLVLGTVLIFRGGSGPVVAISLLLGTWWLLCPLLRWPARVRKDFHEHPNLSREYVAQIDSDGIRTRSDIGESQRTWLAYMKYRETDKVFMLYSGARIFEIIPKRAFSTSQLQEATELFRNKLPN